MLSNIKWHYGDRFLIYGHNPFSILINDDAQEFSSYYEEYTIKSVFDKKCKPINQEKNKIRFAERFQNETMKKFTDKKINITAISLCNRYKNIFQSNVLYTCDIADRVTKNININTSIWYYRDQTIGYSENYFKYIYPLDKVEIENTTKIKLTDLKKCICFVHLPINFNKVYKVITEHSLNNIILIYSSNKDIDTNFFKIYNKFLYVKGTFDNNFIILEDLILKESNYNNNDFINSFDDIMSKIELISVEKWIWEEFPFDPKLINKYHISNYLYRIYNFHIVYNFKLPFVIDGFLYSQYNIFCLNNILRIDIKTLLPDNSNLNTEKDLYADKALIYFNESNNIDNFYQDISYKIKEKFKSIFKHDITRAYIKLFEILKCSQIKKPIKAFHLCELPGLFILSLTDFYGQYDWIASSLNPTNQRVKKLFPSTDDDEVISDDYNIYKNNKERWVWGNNGSGIIEECVPEFKDIARECDLITSDLGSFKSHFDSEYNIKNAQRAVIEIILNVKDGGNAIFKHFLPASRNMSMIKKLYHNFEKVILYKPRINPTSTEFYIVCLNKMKCMDDPDWKTNWMKGVRMLYNHWIFFKRMELVINLENSDFIKFKKSLFIYNFFKKYLNEFSKL